MEGEGGEKVTIITQVSMGGFDRHVKAKDLTQFLEDQIGMVFRCRLKTSWTVPESYPTFDEINREDITDTDETRKVEPHAFVHFGFPRLAAQALEASANNQLMMDDRSLKVTLGPETPFRMNQMRRTTVPIKLGDVVLEIGTLVSRDDFFAAWRGPRYGVHFLVDPFDGTCKFCFSMDTAFSFKGMPKHVMMKCDFKVEFLVRDINEIKRYTDSSYLVLLLHLDSSPRVWYRTAEDDIEVTVPYNLLDDDDPWIRTMDFTRSGAIGRCNFYRISIPPRHGGKLTKAMDYLREQRVRETSLRWPLKIQDEPDFGISKPDHFFCFQHEDRIPFEVMFLVNVAVHKGIFNQHQISDDFFGLLRSRKTEVNVAALKHISSYKRPVFDAYKRLKLVQEWLLRDPKSLKDSKPVDDLTEVRRLVITPTRAYCLPPEVELSNRVLRKYKDVADRFLRVTFMDEGMESMNMNVLNYHAAPIVKELTSNSFPQRTKIFSRVRTLLHQGFYVCGRKYSFLAFSSNQLRDQSAWFYAEQSLSVKKILSWMGEFNNRNVAKCAARMGLCFSSTYATVEVPETEVNFNLPDIKRNNYVFSDGIGMVTPDLAMEVAKRLKLDVNPPSAYQIRYAGCKGVIACWPPKNGDRIRLSLRPSMNKFKSHHTMLEICSWTRFQPGFLNRQIITLLSSLNVPDEVFWTMQETMVAKLTQMLEDADVAFDVLTGSCAAEQGNDSAIMLSAGFSPKSEPHLRGMLTCIRAAQLWDLREKARIFVPSGRWLMGCLDELGVLEQGQCFVQVSKPSLENYFLKHGSRFSETRNNLEVIKGYVVIAKNPCLHPGDVRVLEAVDSPGLHHLYDCLVFPQKGDRPHTDEASGSDLDGDLYFVTWDGNLIPPSKKSWPPMEYNPAIAKEMKRPITTDDIKEFFSRNMINVNLGTICNAHVVHADLSETGAMDEKCLELAGLAATAVDFPKTGVIVSMPANLKPKLYPDFMGKEAYQSYKSTKILGRLYRHITDSHDPNAPPSFDLSVSVSYDADLEVPGSADFVGPAWDHKRSYDRQVAALMLQYRVKREEEVVTGQIWSMPKYKSRKQGDLKERLNHAYTGLKKEFRQKFESLDPEFDNLSDEERNALYEKKASAWYQVAYGPEWVKKAREDKDPVGGDVNEEAPALLSFAWIATDYLARIKIRSRGVGDSVGPTKPIDSLGKYLADRI